MSWSLDARDGVEASMQEKDLYTIGYDTRALIKPLSDLLKNTAAKFSRVKFPISRSDLQQIEELRAKSIAAVNEQFDTIILTATRRRDNLVTYGHLQFISLGFDCLPRVLLTRWGMKPAAQLGEKTHVFDISIHPSTAVSQVWASGFAGYTETQFEITGTDRAPTNAANGIRFVHELGPEFAADDFKALRAKYTNRIANFRQAVSDIRPTIFLHHSENDTDETQVAVRNIFKTARLVRGQKPTLCIWLCTLKPGAAHNDNHIDTGGIRLDVNYPTSYYTWHWNAHAFSEKGVAFELAAVSGIQQALQAAGWSDRGSARAPQTLGSAT
jgi:hypothetical protein